jgi:hypothetical protein
MDLNSHFTICVVSADHMPIKTLIELGTSVLQIQIIKFFENEFEVRSIEGRPNTVIGTRTTRFHQFQYDSYAACQIPAALASCN